MKTTSQLLKLFAVWIISIITLSLGIIFFIQKDNSEVAEVAASFVIFMFYSLIFSFPAFLFFCICGFIVLRTKLNVRKKKALLILINYIDIIGTGLAFVLLAMSNSNGNNNDHLIHDITKAVTTFYPGWMLVIGSTLAILLMPFKEKTNQ